jgi:hypothetical protein
MQTGQIEFSVEKFTKTMLGTITSVESLLQTFAGDRLGLACPDPCDLRVVSDGRDGIDVGVDEEVVNGDRANQASGGPPV